MEFVHINMKSVKDNYCSLSQQVSYIFHSHNMSSLLYAGQCLPCLSWKASGEHCSQSQHLAWVTVSNLHYQLQVPQDPAQVTEKKNCGNNMTVQVLSTYVTSALSQLTVITIWHAFTVIVHSY